MAWPGPPGGPRHSIPAAAPLANPSRAASQGATADPVGASLTAALASLAPDGPARRRPVSRTTTDAPGRCPNSSGRSYHRVVGVGQVLLIIAAVLGAALVLAASSVAVAWALLRRRLRIAPGVRSSAPSRWMASPERAARLHRRLRAATAQARLAAARPGGELAALADELAAEAVAVERELVIAARVHRSARRHALAAPTRAVTDVERTAAAIAAAAAAAERTVGASVPRSDPMSTIRDRAESVRRAVLDVAAAERGMPFDPTVQPPRTPSPRTPSPRTPSPGAPAARTDQPVSAPPEQGASAPQAQQPPQTAPSPGPWPAGQAAESA